jgi:DNA-binding LytR/AlgR family response regulator
MGEAFPESSPEVLLVEDEALIGLAAGGHADVLFTDVDLGGDIDGTELARRIRAMRAGIAVVYSSGRYGQVEDAVAGSAFLPKPYILAQATAAVERMVARSHAA